MGAKYNNAVISGFNSNPPPDDGSTVDANEMTWAKHLDKLAQPILTLAQTINTRLVTHFDEGPIAQTTNFTLSVANYNQVIEFSGTGLTATLPDASTVGTGFFATIVNASTSEDLTVALATAGNSLQGIVGNSLILSPGQSVRVMVNVAVTGYLVTSKEVIPPQVVDKGLWPLLSSGTDAEHDIDVGLGTILDSTRSFALPVTAVAAKQLDALWTLGGTPGTPLGGRASGADALTINQDWYFFIISRTDDLSAVDFGFDTDPSAANLLTDAQVVNANYTLYRQLGVFQTNASSNLREFSQDVDKINYATAITERAYANVGTAGAAVTISNPAIKLKHDLTLVAGCGASQTIPGLLVFGATDIGAVSYTTSQTLHHMIAIETGAAIGERQYVMRKDWDSTDSAFALDSEVNSLGAQVINHGYTYDRGQP